ncbi:MAG: RNA 2',3'-cyclic phosphodiesterase [Caldiserica bacterium]|nr:RNA 2',3'-cyclic phosphodiesterase [Caldisericota bacterium]
MRAFVAIPLPGSFADWLRPYMTAFASKVPGLRPVPVASCHITLRFLGELPDEQLGDARRRLSLSLAAMPGTSVLLDGFGVFRRDGQPSVLWTWPGVVPRALAALSATVDRSLSGLGSNGRAERFAPHVTLGRFATGTREDQVAAIEAWPAKPCAVPVMDVVLYESVMGQGHPMYIARGAVRLAPFAE